MLSRPSADPWKNLPAPIPAEKLSPKAAMAKCCGMRFVKGEAKVPFKRMIESMARKNILKAFWSLADGVMEGFRGGD